MEEKEQSVFLTQLKAMLVRNLLLKKREKRKTIAVCVTILLYYLLYSNDKCYHLNDEFYYHNWISISSFVVSIRLFY